MCGDYCKREMGRRGREGWESQESRVSLGRRRLTFHALPALPTFPTLPTIQAPAPVSVQVSPLRIAHLDATVGKVLAPSVRHGLGDVGPTADLLRIPGLHARIDENGTGVRQ